MSINFNVTICPIRYIGLEFDESLDTYVWPQNQPISWQPDGNSLFRSKDIGYCVQVNFKETSSNWVIVSCDTELPSICQKQGGKYSEAKITKLTDIFFFNNLQTLW